MGRDLAAAFASGITVKARKDRTAMDNMKRFMSFPPTVNDKNAHSWSAPENQQGIAAAKDGIIVHNMPVFKIEPLAHI
jgi:hypothetical protein